MIHIAHRINTIDEIQKVPKEFGVEIDVRDRDERLILNHDPFGDGESLEDYLHHFQHKFLIVNIKSERVELRVLELLNKHNITDYFLLDSTFPMIVSLIKKGVHRIALRFSEYEGMDTLLTMKGSVEWVWIDCFSKMPLDTKAYKNLKTAGYKLCLVSPELQGQGEKLETYKAQLRAENIVVDAVCTKLENIPRWQ